jgi:hypothetical protein
VSNLADSAAGGALLVTRDAAGSDLDQHQVFRGSEISTSGNGCNRCLYFCFKQCKILRRRNLAMEGIDEILTVTRLGLPKELRRSLACTNLIENAMSTVRPVCRNVKRWPSASMAMCWTAAAMPEAARGFR